MAYLYEIKKSTVTTKVAVEIMFFNCKMSYLQTEESMAEICEDKGFMLVETVESYDNGFKAMVVPMSTIG